MATGSSTMEEPTGGAQATVAVRDFAPSDATACCWIINANVAVMAGLNEPARRLIINKHVPDRLVLELGKMHAVVAVDGDDMVVGVAALDGSELTRFHVAQSHQGRGIGGALLMALEDRARKSGVHRLELLASPSSEAFYASYGYVSLGEDRATSGNAEFVNVRMEKELSASS
jgi:GNAT superfamily N-acetyltransferase